jgi:hypothetical protein
MFELLTEYKKEFQHVSPQRKGECRHKMLGRWLMAQREVQTRLHMQRGESKMLSRELIQQLDGIAFVCCPNEYSNWMILVLFGES